MKSFNDYAKNNQNKVNNDQNVEQNLFETFKNVAKQYEGASESELLGAILKQAKQSKQNGTLSNKEIDNFVNAISPMLNESQKSKLNKIIDKIK